MEPAIDPAGGWEVTLLEIGRARHPGDWVGPGFPEWMWTPMNGLLLQRPGQTILVDTGSGVLTYLWAFEGIVSEAPQALAAAGVEPGGVDLVVLTHLDDDHIGGLLEGTWPDDVELAFPRARVVAPRAGVQAVLAGEGLPVGIEERRRLVGILQDAGVLDEVDPGDEVAAGVRLRDAPGHRAGHVCVEVGGEWPLVHIADTLHHEVHVEHPEWDGPADDDRALALATRTSLLAELAGSGARVVASHLSGPHALSISASADGGFEAHAAER
jgi:glyoxylase-like metal-dependent hydrolase (beta-lactamase superfamily II)